MIPTKKVPFCFSFIKVESTQKEETLGWVGLPVEEQNASLLLLRDLLASTDPMAASDVEQQTIQQILYIAYGTWGEVDSVQSLQDQILTHLTPLLTSGLWPLLYHRFVLKVQRFLEAYIILSLLCLAI